MFHTITLIGRVGQDPETRTTKTGLEMATFSAAVDIKGQKGTKLTVWPKITAFGQLSKIVSQYVHKGSTVFVEGRLSPDATTGAPKIYTKKDGSMASSYDIVAEKVQVIASDKTSSPAIPTFDDPSDLPF